VNRLNLESGPFAARSAIAIIVASAALASGCAALLGRSTSPAALQNTVWQWQETFAQEQTFRVETPERYTINFDPSLRAAVRFDCNRGGGTYKIDGDTLTISGFATTRMACPAGSVAPRFADELLHTRSFYVNDDGLYLVLADDAGTMHFTRAKPRLVRESP